MSDNGKGGGATTQEAQSASENQETETTEAKETVSYDTYRRTVNEVKKLKTALAERESAEQAAKQKALEEQGQWKAVAESKAKTLTELQQKLDHQTKMIHDSVKMSAFLKMMPGTVAEEYWDLIKLDEIVLDPETQKPDAVALESYAKSWAQKHSRLIDRPTTAKAPTEAPKVAHISNELSVHDIALKLASMPKQ